MQEHLCDEFSPSAQRSSAALPACCGTGCTVCVLDYPELFRHETVDSQTQAMLEAIEQAQASFPAGASKASTAQSE